MGVVVAILVLVAVLYFMIQLSRRPDGRSAGRTASNQRPSGAPSEMRVKGKGPSGATGSVRSCAFSVSPFSGRYGTHQVKSSSQKGLSYTVDLDALSCTCPGFQKRATAYTDPRDIRRVDKHIARALIQTGAIDEFPQLEQVIIGYEENPREASHDFLGVGSENFCKVEHPSGLQFYIGSGMGATGSTSARGAARRAIRPTRTPACTPGTDTGSAGGDGPTVGRRQGQRRFET